MFPGLEDESDRTSGPEGYIMIIDDDLDLIDALKALLLETGMLIDVLADQFFGARNLVVEMSDHLFDTTSDRRHTKASVGLTASGDMLKTTFPNGRFAPPATEEQIEGVQSILGVPFPEQLWALYRECNGFREDRGNAKYLLSLTDEAFKGC